MKLVLHGYWRSGPSWRLRIALNWKGLAYDDAPVNLLKDEHVAAGHLALNPQGRIPVLEADGAVLTQAPAILEWLEEIAPSPPLLPADPLGRARVRAMSALVACDIAPLQNLGVGQELARRFGADEAAQADWRRTWNARGLEALEALVGRDGGDFCHADAVSLADIHLVTQLYGARRFGAEVERFPRLLAVEARCMALPAFQAAHPDRQPDAPPT